MYLWMRKFTFGSKHKNFLWISLALQDRAFFQNLALAEVCALRVLCYYYYSQAEFVDSVSVKLEWRQFIA